MPDTLQPGDFMVTATRGVMGWCIRRVTRSAVNHAAVYVGAGQIIEADPAGALLSAVSKYPRAIWSSGVVPLTGAQRAQVARRARALRGVRYSWLDDAAIGLAKLFGTALPGFVRRRLSRPDRLMCSQLVDVVYKAAGVRLFDDDRPPGDVSPGDLLDVLTARAGAAPVR